MDILRELSGERCARQPGTPARTGHVRWPARVIIERHLRDGKYAEYSRSSRWSVASIAQRSSVSITVNARTPIGPQHRPRCPPPGADSSMFNNQIETDLDRTDAAMAFHEVTSAHVVAPTP